MVTMEKLKRANVKSEEFSEKRISSYKHFPTMVFLTLPTTWTHDLSELPDMECKSREWYMTLKPY